MKRNDLANFRIESPTQAWAGMNALRAVWAATDASSGDTPLGLGTYYVNDGSTSNDAWCTAVGDDANDGVTPASPKATVQAILVAYDLEPGDVVRIDTGTYRVTSDITVGSAEGGSNGLPVVFEASPYGVTMDRDNAIISECVWSIGASHVRITTARGDKYPLLPQSWMKVTGARYGIRASGGFCRVDRINASNNRYSGISLSGPVGTVANCVACGNSGGGIDVLGNDSTVSNCTLYGNSGHGIYIGGYGSVLRNNIVRATGVRRYGIVLSSGNVLSSSDYNDVYVTNGAYVGCCSSNLATLVQWRSATGKDTNSFSSDPLFVDASGGDFHLRSTVGSYHGGAWLADSANSPCIDVGDPGSEWASEPEPNGGRMNLGAYGGTEQASKTPTNRLLRLLSPVGGECYPDQATPASIRWSWVGGGWRSDDTIRLECSMDGGVTWSDVPGAGAVVVTNGLYDWDIGRISASMRCRVRVTSCEDWAVTDASSGNFRIGRRTFYVNDGSASHDEWCTAAGSDANDGLTPTTPKATVPAILTAYGTEPGDTVRIDTGVYRLTTDIRVSSGAGGSNGMPVVFEASPYGVTLDRGSRAYEVSVWNIEAPYVRVFTVRSDKYPLLPQSWMKVTGAGYGVRASGNFCRLDRIDARGNEHCGVYISGSDGTVANCVLGGSGSGYGGAGIYVCGAETVVSNCTYHGNGDYGVYVGSRNSVLRNNIVSVSGAGNYGIYVGGVDCLPLCSDYNDVHVTSGAAVGYYLDSRGSFGQWCAATGKDTNSFSRDPLFVDVSGGDYHLQSTAGSYHGGVWRADGADSPCIDAGGAGLGWANEPEPNGGRMNLGAYGGTEQASKTFTNRLLRLLAPTGGERYRDEAMSVSVSWSWAGGGWRSNDTIRLEYSTDAGASWSEVAGAGAVAVTNGRLDWNLGGIPASLRCRVRVSCCEDTAVTGGSPGDFRIGGPWTYYVNDGSTNNDEWCVAVGEDVNDGATPATPKASVQAILDSYVLEPGETVRMDTGTYRLPAQIVVDCADGGSNGMPVVFEASPYGVTMDRGGTGYGYLVWYITAPYVRITTARSDKYPLLPQSWMKVTGAYHGIEASGDFCWLERIDACDNEHVGIEMHGLNGTVANCLVRGNRNANDGAGIYVEGKYTVVSNCTLYMNGGDGIYVIGTNSVLRNNIVGVSGAGNYGIHLFQSACLPHFSDYNDVYVTNGAHVGYCDRDMATLRDWRRGTGRDTNSLSCDPLFVDESGGDFHLRSTGGSYHGGAWIADDTNSLCIDAGDPESEWANEREPNGGRMNLGAYGGTEQASKTPTNRLLRLLAPVCGEVYPDQATPLSVRWSLAGEGWRSNDTIKVEYSTDAGATWSVVSGAGGVAATNGWYAWDIGGIPAGTRCRARATCNEDRIAWAWSSGDFRIGRITYYVNDESTSNDEWCVAVGDDGNDGLTPASPKASVPAILMAYGMEAGDTVRIDTGTYRLTNAITLNVANGGVSTMPVLFEASPYGVTLDGDGHDNWGRLWSINASHVRVTTAHSDKYPLLPQSWMKVTGADCGIDVAGDYCRVERVNASNNRFCGIEMSGRTGTVANCVMQGNKGEHGGAGICVYGNDMTVSNCTFHNNGKYGIYVGGYDCVLRNNIVSGFGAGSCGIYVSWDRLPRSCDYNNVHVGSGAYAEYNAGFVATLEQWRSVTGKDTNSLSCDPLFVDEVGGDFHLRSTAGSYHGGAWTADDTNSPCIDAGDPASGWGNEPEPNGLRVNLGAYGGTEQASMTCSNTPFFVVVISEHGTAQPSVGDHDCDYKQELTCRISQHEIVGNIRYTCVGWRLAGLTDIHGQTSGSATSVSLIVTNHAELTWLWSVDNWVDHFAWDPLPTQVLANAPFDVTIRAKDVTENTVTGYTGGAAIRLRAAQDLADNVEGGTNGWTHMGRNDQWHISANRALSPGHAWYCGTDAWRRHVDDMDCSLISSPLVVDKGAKLSFWHWYDTEECCDYGAVDISTNSGYSYNSLASFRGSSETWIAQTNDLSEYAGQTVLIRFRFYSDSNVSDEGWYVDDIVLTGGTAASLRIVSPHSGDFVDGVWTGALVVLDAVSNVVLSADDGSGHTGTSATFDVGNQPQLTVSIPARVMEGDGVLTNAGMVSIPTSRVSSVDVTILLTDATEMTLTSRVTIPAGLTEAYFDLAIVDDAEADGAQKVTLTVLAPGYAGATATVTVADNDVHHFDWSFTDGPKTAAAPFCVTIEADDSDGLRVPTFGGTARLSAFCERGLLPMEPLSTGSFTGGVWTGLVSVPDVGSHVVLVAEMTGATGVSSPFRLTPIFDFHAVESPQAVGVPFEVAIVARDALGGEASNFTGSVNLAGYAGRRVLDARFEDGLDGLVISNGYGAGKGLWHRTAARSWDTNHTAAYSLYYGCGEGPDGGGGYDAGYTEGAVLSSNMDLTGVTPPVVLSFKYLITTEPDPDYDFATVEVSREGGPFEVVAGNKKGAVKLADPTGNEWRLAHIDLSSFVGSVVRILFRFDSVDRTHNGYEGWYLDDVRFTTGDMVPVPVVPVGAVSFDRGVWTGRVAVVSKSEELCLAADWCGDGRSLSDAFAVLDFRTLAVLSAHGGALPAVGTTGLPYGSRLTCSALESSQCGGVGTQYVCSGWSMAGNEPVNGRLSDLRMVLTNDATLVWLWNTNYWLATEVNGPGIVSVTSGWWRSDDWAPAEALPAAHCHFASWSGDTNGATIEGASIAVSMTGAKSIVANFAENVSPLGTPEPWLARYGLTNGVPAAEEVKDADGDGLCTWEEYVADTDPTNRGSALSIVTEAPDGNGGMRLEWRGGRWARQYVQSREDLTGPGATWISIYTNAGVPTEITNALIDTRKVDGRVYYRIKVER